MVVDVGWRHGVDVREHTEDIVVTTALAKPLLDGEGEQETEFGCATTGRARRAEMRRGGEVGDQRERHELADQAFGEVGAGDRGAGNVGVADGGEFLEDFAGVVL